MPQQTFTDKIIALLVSNFSLSNLESIAVILTAIFIAYQLQAMKKDYKIKNQRYAYDTAIKMARFYSTNILPAMSLITLALEPQKLNITFKKIEEAELNYFDSEECEDILTKEERHTLLVFFDLNKDIILRKTINETANNLEYFSMYFTSKLAEDELVYQSLHQTFLQLVHILYFYIASTNQDRDSTQRYFTYTIELYKKWHEKNEKNKLEAKKQRDDMRKSSQKSLSLSK